MNPNKEMSIKRNEGKCYLEAGGSFYLSSMTFVGCIEKFREICRKKVFDASAYLRFLYYCECGPGYMLQQSLSLVGASNCIHACA